MSKSKRTQRRYRKANCNQTSLESFAFSISRVPALPPVPDLAISADIDPEPVTIRQESVEVEIPWVGDTTHTSIEVQTPVIQRESTIPQAPGADNESSGVGWEDDLDECVHAGVDVRGWALLRDQIKQDLKVGAKTLPMSKINQLLVLRNFATLRLKGCGIIEAGNEITRQWHEGEGKHYARKV
jgi:hypothetical protein